MSARGHSRPRHSVPVPINVRCYSNGDVIVRRSEVTLGPPGLMQCVFRGMAAGLGQCSEERRVATGANFCIPSANADTLAGKPRQDADRRLKVPRIMPLLELL
jgi:hypothetical protein